MVKVKSKLQVSVESQYFDIFFIHIHYIALNYRDQIYTLLRKLPSIFSSRVMKKKSAEKEKENKQQKTFFSFFNYFVTLMWT